MSTMTTPMGPSFYNVPLEVLGRDLDKDGRELLETLQKASAATSTTTSGDMFMEPASKKQKLSSEDSAVDALLRAGRKKPPWTPTEQAVVAIKHCELGNRWTQIAAYLPLRSENDVKNIWHSTLRCKDTQKRSFLRTYALAVHDHAYDYPTRKAMFDIAVRQCGPPPPQAAEMIARVQMLMDNPELAAAQQTSQFTSPHVMPLDQMPQPHSSDQLSQLSHLLSKREDLAYHPQLAHLAHLQQQLTHPQDYAQHSQDDGSTLAFKGSAKDLDGRRPQSSRDYAYSEQDAAGSGPEPSRDDRLPMERSGSLQQKLQHMTGSLPVPAGQPPLRGLQIDPLDGTSSQQHGHTDSGVSAIRRHNAGSSGDGGSGGGSGSGRSYVTAPADPLAIMAATAANEAPASGTPAAAAGAAPAAAPTPGEALPSRPPNMPLGNLGSLLALLYKYNIEQVQGPGGGTGKPGGAGWPAEGEEAAAAAAAAAGLDCMAAAAAAAAADGVSAVGPEDRISKLASSSTAAGPPSQSLALRPLSLRPLQTGSELKGEGEEGGASAAAATTEMDGDSPKRPASTASARAPNPATKRSHAAMSTGTVGPRDSVASGPAASHTQAPSPLRNRGSVPYNMQGADADELGAVEALALAARLNTQGSRGAGGSGTPGNTGRASNTGAASAAGNGALVSIRNGASGATPAGAAAAGGRASGTLTPNPSSGPVLDLHARPSQTLSPTPLPSLPPPPPLQSRSSLPFRSPAAVQPSEEASGHLSGPHHLAPRPLQAQAQQQQQQQQGRVGPYLDVVSVLNMPGLRRQVLALPAHTLAALLGSPLFGSDSEASVFVLVALWLQANNDSVTPEQIRKLCSAVRLAALGGFYVSAVLPLLVTDPRVAGKGPAAAAPVRPGSRWFEMRSEEMAFLTRYINAGGVERALLADVAQGVYDCTSPWYDMTPRSMGMPSEGFCFEWSIPKQGLRDALSNGAQPHATFTVREDINDGDDASAGAASGVAIVPYIICRGLEWHVFVDCQQRPGGAVAAGVFVYCRAPGVLRPPPGSTGPSVIGVVPGAGIRLGVHGWRCGRLEEVFVWTFGDETYFVPDAGMGCPSALPLRKRPTSPPGSSVSRGAGGGGAGGANGGLEDGMAPWADYLHDGGLRGTLTFLPPS